MLIFWYLEVESDFFFHEIAKKAWKSVENRKKFKFLTFFE